jgi:crotonobetainyl-CoA:carnitine CoA-transferase CaiB-like acyl-CoA transferase
MIDVVLSVCERIVHQNSYAGVVAHPEGNQHPILTPFGVFPASDGYVSIGAPTDEWWQKLCHLIERSDLLADETLATNALRTKNRERVFAIVEDFTRPRSKKRLMEIFGGKIPFGPVYDIADIAQDPHFAVRDMIVETRDPSTATPVKLAGVPIKFTETPGRVWSGPPGLGEHTDVILGAAGLMTADIAELRRRKIVQ